MTSSNSFTHGYALLIGVNDNQVARLRLPDVAKDVAALAEVLTHPERCAYPQENIKIIQNSAATRNGILAGLKWLRERLAADENATAVAYYSGHGHRDENGGELRYALLPYDIDLDQIEISGLAATDFARAIENLRPQRLLVILDCCHAAGMDAKDLGDLAEGLVALPAEIFLSGVTKGTDGSPLQQGHGRAILNSSQGSERSYMRPDGKMSLFTYHLIEALTGHAQPQGGATEVLVSDVLSYVSRQVPASAQAMKRQQTPEFKFSGSNFPIALLIGGKGLAKGEAAPDPLVPLPTATSVQQSTNTGPGAIAQGAGAVAAGQRGVAIGGNASGATITTGDNNRVEQVHTSGAAYLRGNVTTGRDFIARDKVMQGDEVHGDKVIGDKISTGNIDNSQVAIGQRASVTVQQSAPAAELAALFADIYRQIDARHDDLATDREELRETVKRIEQELQKGKEAANTDRLKRWLITLNEIAPDIFKALVSILTNPVAQVSSKVVNLARMLRG